MSGVADRRNAADAGARDRVDATAWIAVAAGTLGAFMATLDVSIVNSALPTIQGEVGASATEATWVATAYLVAEIVIIPLAAWFERVLGLRTFLLVAAVSFTLFSVVCGMATNLLVMIVGRVGQGFTGGAMIPTAQTIIAQRLPPSQQPVGIAVFGITAILGPVMGPVVGGWLTETYSWHYAFFLNVPLCLTLCALLLVGLPHERSRLQLVMDADWCGIFGIVLCLGSFTVLLEEGQREQWFSSSLIRAMAVLTAAGAVLFAVGQLSARRPVLNIGLLANPQFGSITLMSLSLGVVMYGSSYIIPQFLSFAADYNALQSGYVLLLAGLPSIFIAPLVPLLLRTVDIRFAVSVALSGMAASSLLDAFMTIDSAGPDFTMSQLLRGASQIIAMLFLSQAAVRAVPVASAGDASGLFNAARNLGGSLALAAVATLQERRSGLHIRRLEEGIAANAEHVQSFVRDTGNPAAALARIRQVVASQAGVMTFNDMFWLMGLSALAVLPLVFLLRPLPRAALSAALH